MSEGGWVGVAGLFVTLLFGWLNKRDSLRHDEDVRELKAQNTTQAGQIATQSEQIATLTAKVGACEEEREVAYAERKACQEQQRTTEIKIAQLEQTVNSNRPTS